MSHTVLVIENPAVKMTEVMSAHGLIARTILIWKDNKGVLYRGMCRMLWDDLVNEVSWGQPNPSGISRT